MVVQGVSLVRAAAPRSRALSLANTGSIGFRSDEQGGRESRLAPVALIAASTPATLWAADDHVAGPQRARQDLLATGGGGAGHRAVRHHGRHQAGAVQPGHPCPSVLDQQRRTRAYESAQPRNALGSFAITRPMPYRHGNWRHQGTSVSIRDHTERLMPFVVGCARECPGGLVDVGY